ncbi:MAG: redoxin domain-containing protein [Bacteroidota bacterium]
MADSVTVFVFLSETCPICKSYTLPLKTLYKTYKDKPLKFIGVFPNYYSTQQEIAEFKKTYAIPFELIKDDGTLTKKFNATVTPQAFVLNSKGEIVYSGRIDNSFYAIGKRRTTITSNDLDNAIKHLLAKDLVTTPSTEAVGCIITLKEP